MEKKVHSDRDRKPKLKNLVEWDQELKNKTLFLVKILARMYQKQKDKKFLRAYFDDYDNTSEVDHNNR
jgi:hypothetical protein